MIAADARRAVVSEPAPAILRAPATTRRAPPATPGEIQIGKIAENAAEKTAAAPAAPPTAPDTTAILNRGQMAFDRGDYPEAVRRGREAIAAGAEESGRLLIGDAYYRLERYRDALREYDAALALDPTNAGTRRRRDLAEQKSSLR